MEKMLNILVVDDNSNMRALITETLEELEDYGIDLLATDNGEDALEIIKTKKPNLVILDIMMPGISGIEVCNTVKNVLGLKSIYIILLTAQSQWIDRRRGSYAGADNYITKPFDSDELFKVVSGALGIKL